MTTLANDRLVATMRAADIPVDRENYIVANWGDPPPEPWTPEHESEIPEELQDWSWLKLDNVGGPWDEDVG